MSCNKRADSIISRIEEQIAADHTDVLDAVTFD